MLTKNDLRNLRYLIYTQINRKSMDAKSIFRRLRRKVKKAVKERKIPQPTLLTPEAMIPILRNPNYKPTLIAGTLFTEFAKEKSTLGEKIETPFEEIFIDGGPAHDFVRGFIDRPWRLVKQSGTSSQFEKGVVGFKHVEKTEILDQLWPKWRIDLPEKKRQEWQKIIDRYQESKNVNAT